MLDPVAEAYLQLYPREAALTLARLEDAQIVELIAALTPELSAAALEHLGLTSARACLQQLPDETVAAIIEPLLHPLGHRTTTLSTELAQITKNPKGYHDEMRVLDVGQKNDGTPMLSQVGAGGFANVGIFGTEEFSKKSGLIFF